MKAILKTLPVYFICTVAFWMYWTANPHHILSKLKRGSNPKTERNYTQGNTQAPGKLALDDICFTFKTSEKFYNSRVDVILNTWFRKANRQVNFDALDFASQLSIWLIVFQRVNNYCIEKFDLLFWRGIIRFAFIIWHNMLSPGFQVYIFMGTLCTAISFKIRVVTLPNFFLNARCYLL